MGTPALTTRGMKEPEMKEIAALIDKVVSNFGDEEVYAQVKQDILTLCQRFPLYKERLEKE
jgi:glycine hydroxymethyltransferase